MTLVLGEGHQVGVSPCTHCGVWFLTWFFEPHNLIQCLSELQLCLMSFLMQCDERREQIAIMAWPTALDRLSEGRMNFWHVTYVSRLPSNSWGVEEELQVNSLRSRAFLCHCYCEEGGTEDVKVPMRHDVSRGQKICGPGWLNCGIGIHGSTFHHSQYKQDKHLVGQNCWASTACS